MIMNYNSPAARPMNSQVRALPTLRATASAMPAVTAAAPGAPSGTAGKLRAMPVLRSR